MHGRATIKQWRDTFDRDAIIILVLAVTTVTQPHALAVLMHGMLCGH